MQGWRAERIARTETMWATRTASIQQYEANGVQEMNLLIAADACDDCQEVADGNPYSIDEVQSIGDSLHPNCRCDWEMDKESIGLN